LGQLVGLQLLHTPWLHPAAAQVWHASPPAPQAASASPGKQRLSAQHPAAQLLPSHTQAPPTQCWPAEQGAPAPQAQAPSAEQPSLSRASQATHAAPAGPQVARARGWQMPPAQHPAGHEVTLQAAAPSRRQRAEQPSPERVLPSSHSSISGRSTPSPQMAGAPRVSVTSTSSARRTTTAL
jgi:hypothetical protein